MLHRNLEVNSEMRSRKKEIVSETKMEDTNKAELNLTKVFKYKIWNK